MQRKRSVLLFPALDTGQERGTYTPSTRRVSDIMSTYRAATGEKLKTDENGVAHIRTKATSPTDLPSRSFGRIS